MLLHRQHELPPRKGRSVLVPTRGGSGGNEGAGRLSVPLRGHTAGGQGRPPGCAGLPLRDEQKRQRVHQEEGLRHHQEPPPEQGELLPLHMGIYSIKTQLQFILRDDGSHYVICILLRLLHVNRSAYVQMISLQSQMFVLQTLNQVEESNINGVKRTEAGTIVRLKMLLFYSHNTAEDDHTL